MIHRIGYACLNHTLKEQGSNKRRVYLKQFQSGGLDLITEIALHNLEHLEKCLFWNHQNGIYLFRFTQIFPWVDKYEFDELPKWDLLLGRLLQVGRLATDLNQRLTVHPSEFCVVASPTESSVEGSMKELNQVSKIFDLMGFTPSRFNKINIHIGGVYGNKEETMNRFCENLIRRGSDSLLSRLTIENDDRPSGYTVDDLFRGVYERIGTPIVFDRLHYLLNPGELNEKDSMTLAFSTWDPHLHPIIHYSESKRDVDGTSKANAHSMDIRGEIETFDLDFDVMIESKGCELSAVKYIHDHPGKVRAEPSLIKI